MTVRRPCSGMAVLRRQLQIVVIIIIIINWAFEYILIFLSFPKSQCQQNVTSIFNVIEPIVQQEQTLQYHQGCFLIWTRHF